MCPMTRPPGSSGCLHNLIHKVRTVDKQSLLHSQGWLYGPGAKGEAAPTKTSNAAVRGSGLHGVIFSFLSYTSPDLAESETNTTWLQMLLTSSRGPGGAGRTECAGPGSPASCRLVWMADMVDSSRWCWGPTLPSGSVSASVKKKKGKKKSQFTSDIYWFVDRFGPVVGKLEAQSL